MGGALGRFGGVKDGICGGWGVWRTWFVRRVEVIIFILLAFDVILNSCR